jgi:hypothetical protein
MVKNNKEEDFMPIFSFFLSLSPCSQGFSKVAALRLRPLHSRFRCGALMTVEKPWPRLSRGGKSVWDMVR